MSTTAGIAEAHDREPTCGTTWGRGVRWLVSALVLWHLAAVVIAPLSIPPTRIGEYLHPIFRPYLAATFLDHGYRFFAPDPGPSHLVRYELEYDDGTHRGGVFPNLAEEQPRLFYHRHFMLSEFVNLGPPDLNVPPQTEWAKMPLSPWQQSLAQSYADHMLHKYNARRVTLWQREHNIPSQEQVIKGMRLDDKTLYAERKLGSFARMP